MGDDTCENNEQSRKEGKEDDRGSFCVAWGCSNRFIKGSGLKFHTFPQKNDALLKQWVAAIRRENFTPTNHSRICGNHFLSTDYHYAGSKYLKKDVVPSVFNSPTYLQKKPTVPRRELKRKISVETCLLPPMKPASPKKSPSKEELKSEVTRLKREVKTLKQKVKRKETKINALSNIIDDLKEQSLIDENTAVRLRDKFSGTTLELIKNQLANQGKTLRGRRYDP